MNDTINLSAVTGDISELLKKLISSVTVDDTDEYGKRYVGQVIQHDLDTYSNKVKIRVFGLFDEIPDTAIPWSFPLYYTKAFEVPPLNSIVNVVFDNNDIYRPMYTTRVNSIKSSYMNDGKTHSAKQKYDSEDEFSKLVVPLENDHMMLQYDRARGRINYQSADGVVFNITPNDFDGPDFQAGDADVKNSLNIAIGGENNEYSLSISEHQIIISNGTDETISRLVIKDDKVSLIADEGIAEFGTGSNKTVFNEQTTMRSTSPGQAVPDPAKMGPYCAIPICPFTGAPHVGNLFTATQEPALPSPITEETNLVKPTPED